MNPSYKYIFKNKYLLNNFGKRFYVNISKNSVPALYSGLIEENRASLARSITLIETTNETKKVLAQDLLDKVLNYLKCNKESRKPSFRIGINCFYKYIIYMINDLIVLKVLLAHLEQENLGNFKYFYYQTFHFCDFRSYN